MKNISLRQLILALMISFSAGNLFSAPDACITVSEPTLNKTVWICKGTWINITGNNCGTPDANDEFSWINLSDPSATTISGTQTYSISDSGYWELTLSNPNLGYTEKDTIHVIWHETPKNFSVNNFSNTVGACTYDNITMTMTGLTPRTTNLTWTLLGEPIPIGYGSSITIQNKNIPFGAGYFANAQYDSTYVLGNFSCIISDDITGFPATTPEVSLPNDLEVCEGVTLKIAAKVNISRGTSNHPATLSELTNVSFRWGKNNNTPGPYLKGGPTNLTGQGGDTLITDPNVGTYSYLVEAKNVLGCYTTDVINIKVNPKPIVDIGTPATICYNNQLVLSPVITGATGALTYAWYPKASLNDSTLQNPTAKPLSTTTYALTVTSASGCKGSGTKTINVSPQLSVNTSFLDSTLCLTDSIQLQATPVGGIAPYSYLWTPNTAIARANTSNPKVSPSTPTTYKVTVTDSKNCTANESLNIDILTVNLGGTDTLGIIGDTVKLNAFNSTQIGFSYSWKDSSNAIISTTKSLNSVASNNYTVIVYNPSTMCSVSDIKNVRFSKEIIQKIYVPTAFNPSMPEPDNSNLRVYGNNVSDQNFIFQVYNNWGELIYETNTFSEANQNGWNGSLKNKGDVLMNGVYTYSVRGQFYDGSKFEKTGTASLLK